MSDPFQVVRSFESALCDYTGARYAVAVSSCTMALLLSLRWCFEQVYPDVLDGGERVGVLCPSKTYVSVPQSIIHAGGFPIFWKDFAWEGAYELRVGARSVWDCARRFTSGMYVPGQMQCLSFHTSKILGDTQGGAILHDDAEADVWLRRARFDGRTEGVAPKDDHFDMLGWHCYLSPDVAARLLWAMSHIPDHNPDLPNDDYPDLSRFEVFQ